MIVARDTFVTLFGVGNIGALLQFHFDNNPKVTHKIFCKRAKMSTPTLNKWLKATSISGMQGKTFDALARGLEWSPALLKSELFKQSGSHLLLSALATSGLVADADQWMKNFAKFIAWNRIRAEQIVHEVQAASELAEKSHVA